MPIDLDCLVDDVMRISPATIRTFLDHRMQCVGCPIARLHTLADACREHGLDAMRFLDTLRGQARARPS